MNPVHLVSALSVVLLFSSATAQFDNSVHTYTVNGTQLSLACGGQGGGPVVVFVGGPTSYPVAMSVFESVFTDVNQYARSCSYDTPGTGMSDPPPSVLNGRQQTALLHGVLAQAGIKGQLLLVTHGYASQLARLYVDKYPADVAGVVFVHPWLPDKAAALNQFFRTRPLAQVHSANSGALQDLKQLAQYAQAYVSGKAAPITQWDVAAGDRQLSPIKLVGKLPVGVVTPGQNLFSGPGESAATLAFGKQFAQLTQEQEAILTKLSNNHRQWVSTTSADFVELDDAALVGQAIRAVFDAARTHTALK